MLAQHGRKEDYLMESVFGHSGGEITRDVT
jgi:hypothetical protein